VPRNVSEGLRNPRVWLYVAGGWLVFAGLAHLGFHVWGLVLENDSSGGLREFAMNAMKQAQSPDPLRPSMWRVYRLHSVYVGLLWLFAGGVDMVTAVASNSSRLWATVGLGQTAFWTLAFVPAALIDPVIQPLIVAAIAVPLHGIVYLTAEQAEVTP